jgi:hypothetical protein
MSDTSEETNELIEQFNAEPPSLTEDPEEDWIRTEPPVQERMTTIKIGNVEYPILGAKRVVSETAEQVLYAKDDRKNLSTDEKTVLFKSAVQTAHKKYDVLPLSLEDEDKLDDTYNLEVLVQKTKREHFKYDMHDVFTIVIPNDDETIASTMDLYTEYSNITIEQVARSNLWYREWMVAPYFEQNLQLTYDFFQNNVSDDLSMKISETYETFKAGEQGGPLFFILMMNHLLSDTEEAALSLNERVKKFSIKSVQGENIYRVVSLLRGAVKRLQHINKMPVDIVRTLLTVMQTSSVDAFNAQFNNIQKQRKQNAVLKKTGGHEEWNVDDIFTLAQSEYRDMLNDNTWNGIHTKGTDSIFQAGGGPPKGGFEPECWNCTGKHRVDECTQPKDQKRIEANRKKFLEKKKNNKTIKKFVPNPKWKRPEKGEENTRTIDGKLMFFDWDAKRWFPEGDQTAKQGPTPPPTGPPSVVGGANMAGGTGPPSITDSDIKKKSMQLQHANMLARVQGTLADLVTMQDAFLDEM